MERLPLEWQVILTEKAFYQNRFQEAVGQAMDALKIQQWPLAPSGAVNLISETGDHEIAHLVTLFGILVKSYLAMSAQAWTPKEALQYLVRASNIRDVVFHNLSLDSKLSRLNNFNASSVEMARDEALLLETAAPLFYGQKRQKLLTNSRQHLESVYQKLPEDHPLRCELNLDLCFYQFRHSSEIDKVELGKTMLENFKAVIGYSKPELLAVYAAGVREVGARFSNGDLMWDGQNTLSNLWRDHPALPKPVFEERCLLGEISFRKSVSSLILPFALVFSRDFREKRGQLSRDLGHPNHIFVQMAVSGKSG